ncbi:MAG: HAMP domain-containing histidine kinase [Clostridia bacterium]|nr:HAMP domain-containing histidine kinase [Clostridia bacterium]
MFAAALKKVFLAVLAFAVILVLSVIGLDTVNLNFSKYAAADENCVAATGLHAGALNKIENIQPESGDSEAFTISALPAFPSYYLIIDNLGFAHEIYINSVLVSQNVDRNSDNFSSDYAYKVFSLGKYTASGGDINIQISGTGSSGINLYLADGMSVRDSIEIQASCNHLQFFLLLLITLVSAILYLNNRSSRLFLVLGLIGALSIIRAISTGEMISVARVLGFTFKDYLFWYSFASAVNLFLPVLAMVYLFNIETDKRLRIAALAGWAALAVISAHVGISSVIYLVLAAAVYSGIIFLSVYGFVKGKAYSKILLISNTLYFAFALYGCLVFSGVLRSGALDFYIYPLNLGAVICLAVFFSVFIKDYFTKLRELVAKKEELEKFALLRRISQDLKRPISAIKGSNQLLNKYEIDDNARRECAKMSSDAVAELEKMTTDINDFLNLEIRANKYEAASVRDCFEKTKRRYTAVSEDFGCSFSAAWAGQDVSVPIKPLHFERMLFNLLENAFAYNKKGGWVSLSCSTQRSAVVINVKDNGTGIEADRIDGIFSPACRTDGRYTHDGPGLGLSLVKSVVDNLNGEMKIESERDKGATITVIIPLG